jgi:PPOX class probable FMN-dependent enzyme
MSDEVCDVDRLRAIYGETPRGAIDKAIDHLDDGVRTFVEHSPLVVISTGDGTSNDASPRGGPPGFVRALDDHRLAFGDLVGNNRIDSYRNLAHLPAIGMLFVIPGLLETLRVNGRAVVSTDAELRERCAIDGRVPRVAIVIEVDECYIHCGAALRRARVWDVDTWPARNERPSPSAILKTHLAIDVAVEDIEADLEQYHDHGIWHVGGTVDEPI